jgi:hypothetical protein
MSFVSPTPFPYKTSFIQTTPQEFLHNLRNEKGLIEIVKGSKIFPIKMISDSTVYEKVNIITDLYTEPVRMKARLSRKMSPIEFWTRDEKIIRIESRKRFGKEDNFSLRETIYLICKEATSFSPVLSKCIFDNLLPEKGGVVLDPFSGWGDRAIGALGSDRVLKYQGVDCNLELSESYKKIKTDLDTTGKIDFTMCPFEDFKGEDDTYDLVFTSPPFFDFEVYSDDKSQSIRGKKNYGDWFDRWMTLVLNKIVRLVKHGGYIALHIGPTNRSPTLHDDVWEHLTKICKINYIQQIDCSVRGKRSIPIWVYRKD